MQVVIADYVRLILVSTKPNQRGAYSNVMLRFVQPGQALITHALFSVLWPFEPHDLQMPHRPSELKHRSGFWPHVVSERVPGYSGVIIVCLSSCNLHSSWTHLSSQQISATCNYLSVPPCVCQSGRLFGFQTTIIFAFVWLACLRTPLQLPVHNN